jgi:hypothetical protein
MAGASFDEIAESLGYADRGGAFKAVMTALNSTLLEPAAEVRELELKRLDRLWLAVWDLATKGDLQAVDACLRIMKRRADFEGLDAPRDMRHSGNVQLNLTDEQRAERITALLERARARAQIVEGDAGGEKSSPSDVPQPAPGLANGSAPTHSPTPPPPPPLFGT